MEKIIQQINEWPFLRQLPETMMDFRLVVELKQYGTQYRIFTYSNLNRRRNFSVLYDQTTKEYFVRLVIGLTEFYDIRFIADDLNTFETLLAANMEQSLRSLAGFDQTSLCSVFRAKKIIEWPFGGQLPEKVAGFDLFIRPTEPVRGINGSYIIIDYSDFAAESGLLIFYNIYRDEFFGELRVRRTPQVVSAFDAKTLAELEENIKANLQITLQNLRKQLNMEKVSD
ncbi:hypothetical protein [Sporolituus thermophilus]|uniref:Uncharacterized protein n=1 Tax=Sporolituus thermophilus DSM 23256 TaxID=1123285 RepID=A0A1G7LF50_9FIRM|nr:hypothetical protein [Sporolituus thermophilus]SDF47944.1 hypothetical protein SAMN05660235_01726 [Sporolituus thermophilus DSM 23256]